MMETELPMDRWVRLTDRMHTAPTQAERREAWRERLDMEITATRRAYEARPSPPIPGS
ncbi:hypothetical protein [Saccharomonospora piscinae]|uniref:hypothetical protein n=1 Tax=Saccharomonospora piscinae TaxID=687388 RepID=UPI001594BC6B|nr:hypothetical protein [Saccharomonospora piscinae]